MSSLSSSRGVLITHCLGYPRIGTHRELKVAIEKYWHGNITQEQLVSTASSIRKENWLLQKEKGINIIPSNDFSLYDQVLDTIVLFGAIPPRFGWQQGSQVSLDTYFTLARGSQEKETIHEGKVGALEMLKWFDTNYHYLVPEFHLELKFEIASNKIFNEFEEAHTLGVSTTPVLLGPISFLMLGKVKEDFDPIQVLLPRLLPLYIEVLERLARAGAQWIQIDEPVLVKDLNEKQREAFVSTYETIIRTVAKTSSEVKFLLATYFDDLGENQELALSLPFHAVHLDFTRGNSNIDSILATLKPTDKILSLGLVNGRNIWKIRYSSVLPLIQKAVAELGFTRVWIAPSCSLLHSPISLESEKKDLPSWHRSVLSFAKEKLDEVVILAKAGAQQEQKEPPIFVENEKAWESFLKMPELNRVEVKERVSQLKEEHFHRKSVFSVRNEKQKKILKLPLFPTTTIGSLPQTAEVRNARLRLRKGELTEEKYKTFIEDQMRAAIQIQEEIDLDVLVTGEFERTDMVEYFGMKLDGFAFTENAWVQSFGTRCVKPPIIYGDVFRRSPMTLSENIFAQKLTQKPVKGMLTGPITILQWSFVREDQTREKTAMQIGLAVRDEVVDLAGTGSVIVQVDEPGFREGLPLKKSRWSEYLNWASKAFRLATSGVEDEVQIHTHMCYAEFGDVIKPIAELDADVISFESSRSQMKLLPVFVNANFKYPNEIGPGVFDIHSPNIPTIDELVGLMNEARKVIPDGQLWVNPDCGLKTRNWESTTQQLKAMVAAAKFLRTAVHS